MQEPASQPEEEQEPAVGHLHLHIEHGDVDTEQTASEHWPGLPVEEEVHVEDPAGDQTSSVGDVEAIAATPPEHAPRVMEEEETSGDSDGEEVDSSSEGMRARRRRGSRKRRQGRRRGGLPVCGAVGTAAAMMLLALVALVASWKRRQRRRGRAAARAG